jgi:hypothetical protein
MLQFGLLILEYHTSKRRQEEEEGVTDAFSTINVALARDNHTLYRGMGVGDKKK